jgi:hypothetical protein
MEGNRDEIDRQIMLQEYVRLIPIQSYTDLALLLNACVDDKIDRLVRQFVIVEQHLKKKVHD